MGTAGVGNYVVALKKTPPFDGALRRNWRRGAFEDDEQIQALVHGHHRSKRRVYDLLYMALAACGLEQRVPHAVLAAEHGARR